MALIVSYSRLDKEDVDRLVATMRLIDDQVWFDAHLAGGQEWWAVILKQIRECDVFVYALSKNSQISRHCQAELHYARLVGRHILPVAIGPVDTKRVNPVGDLQTIDCTKPDFHTGVQFCLAVQRFQRQPVALPSPLPDDPEVPYRDLRDMSAALENRQLDPNELSNLLPKVESAFDRDRDDPFACEYIADLLITLTRHPGATNKVRLQAEELLAAIKASRAPAWAAKLPWPRSWAERQRGTPWLKSAASASSSAELSAARVPPAGWYPDPSEAGVERWWDGTAWTDKRR